MPCSDTMASILEESDPLFRQRNEQMRLVDDFIINASAALCAHGEALFDGMEDSFADFGVESHKVRIEKIEAANRGGAEFYRWLIEHWQNELQGLDARNERHTRELPRKKGEKAQNRRDALAVDIPKAELRRKQIEWAKREACLAEPATVD